MNRLATVSASLLAALPCALPAALLAALLGGCFSFEREAPERASFVLDARRDAATAPARDPRVLEVRRFHANPPFGSGPFVYRTGEHAIETDYYNGFLTAPGIAIAVLTRRWLADSRLFASVQGSGHTVEPDWLLEGEIEALYGDYRDPTAARAVLEVRFLVADASDGHLVHERLHTADAPLGDGGPDALVAAWNTALARVLAALEDDLRGLR